MIQAMLRNWFRPAVESVTGGLQGKIYRAARRAFRQSPPGFPEVLTLPPRLGRGLPERVVEIMLARLTYRPGLRVLDIGHANIMECHRRLLTSLPRPRHLTGIDIAEPVYDTSRFYERSLKGDMAASALSDASYDLIWCISTLEHIGMDNSGYTQAFTRGDHLAAQAVREMVRLLSPGGSLLVTVPYGQYEDHGWYINYDAQRWKAILHPVRSSASIHEWYFHHTPDGWGRVTPDVLASVGYSDQQNAGAAGLAAALLTRNQG
jgi:SAM-dependent methyltransferase